jgi:hypothetical protein
MKFRRTKLKSALLLVALVALLLSLLRVGTRAILQADEAEEAWHMQQHQKALSHVERLRAELVATDHDGLSKGGIETEIRGLLHYSEYHIRQAARLRQKAKYLRKLALIR